MKRIIIILTVIAIFSASLSRIAPVIYKNYPPSAVYENLILARNLAMHNVFKIESAKNIILSSSLIQKDGALLSADNNLTPILHSWLFKIFGFKTSLPLYASILLFAFSNVFLFFIILKLFSYWPAVIFSLFSIFMPVVWLGSIMPGFYEFAIFFFSLALLVYFWGGENRSINLIIAGVLLGLSVLSRNAFFISILPLFAYDFYKTKSFKRLLALILPFIIIVGGFFVTDAVKGGANSFLSRKPDSFLTYGHLFTDPYSYYFDRDNSLNEVKEIKDPDISEYLVKYGYSIGAQRFIAMHWNSIIFYPKKLFAVTVFGGPIFVFLMALGAMYLYKNKNDLFKYFFWFWLPFWYIVLALLKTNNWDHFLEISFPLILLLALGVWRIIELKTTKFYSALFVLFVFLQIFSADKWMFHEAYDSSHLAEQHELIIKVKNASLTDSDVAAVDFSQNAPLFLNYYTDKNFIYFAPATIKKLTQEKKIDEAFQYFGVTKMLEAF